MEKDIKLLEQYSSFGIISDEEHLVLSENLYAFTELQAYSNELYTMAFEKYFLRRTPDKARAADIYAKIRDIAFKLSGGVDVSQEVSECRLDLAYIQSGDFHTEAYSIRLGRDIITMNP